jgi:transcription elongation factor GreA
MSDLHQPHLSRQAHDRLRAELEERSSSRRLQISAAIERAREHGDITENADYDAAKNEQAHNEARIRQIEQLLRNAVILEGADSDVVAPGVLVELALDDVDEPLVYLVGSIEERHDTYDVLSTGSPLGQALLGKAPGDEVEWDGPKRRLRASVVDVRPLD